MSTIHLPGMAAPAQRSATQFAGANRTPFNIPHHAAADSVHFGQKKASQDLPSLASIKLDPLANKALRALAFVRREATMVEDVPAENLFTDANAFNQAAIGIVVDGLKKLVSHKEGSLSLRANYAVDSARSLSLFNHPWVIRTEDKSKFGHLNFDHLPSNEQWSEEALTAVRTARAKFSGVEWDTLLSSAILEEFTHRADLD